MSQGSEELVKLLTRENYLKAPALIEAFRAIDRADFVPHELLSEAYGNYPLPIGFGQTISQPLTVAFMLELLAPHPGENILEIGAGSGWQTALLAHCVGQKRGSNKLKVKGEKLGHVVAIERIPELKAFADENVRKYDFIRKGIAEIILNDGSRGYPVNAPYDKIIAAASAEEIPEAWKRELKIDGKIVAPIGQNIVVLDKISKDKFRTKEYFGFIFVPLVSD